MREKMCRNIVILIFIFFVYISGCISSQDSGKGTLELTSSPSGAGVYLDNQYRGTTPCTVADVALGNHTLQFRYQGYQSWSTAITVSQGTSHFYAALTPGSQPIVQPSEGIFQETTQPTAQTRVTIQANKDAIIIGDSISFSGTGPASQKVLLTLYGPGYYAKGVLLEQPKTNSVGSWSYTWNPGYSVQSGSYTMVVDDLGKRDSSRVEFIVTGEGEVTISLNKYFVSKGDTITFSGRCSSGAKTVQLRLSGPDRFSSGVDLGSPSVTADKTWSYTYTFDTAMPAGYYTMSVSDIPRTATSNVQFTLGSSPAS